MLSIKVAQITEVSAGRLDGLTHQSGVWRFFFESGLRVESYAGWILFEHEQGAKLLLGSRDLEPAAEPFAEMAGVLGKAGCEVITFNAMRNTIELHFLKGEDRLSLELLRNSARSANWKITQGEHVETDLA